MSDYQETLASLDLILDELLQDSSLTELNSSKRKLLELLWSHYGSRLNAYTRDNDQVLKVKDYFEKVKETHTELDEKKLALMVFVLECYREVTNAATKEGLQ